MADVSISGLTKTYGSFRAVSDMNLHVENSEFLIFLGPSGCGKTTTLRMLAGFIEPDAGQIRIGTRDVTHEPPHTRNIGLVFQNYALFPHLNIFENVAFGLRRRKLPEAEIRKRVGEALELVKLSHLIDRLPKQMSGGQQQRVSIARALAIRPDILLLDEPLSNLDAKLRLQVREELRSLQKTLGITTIMVTHDQEEAMSVGDRLVLMQSGVIEQVGSARDLYERPASRFVADFIGRTNFLQGEAFSGGIFKTESGLVLHHTSIAPSSKEVLLRPESIRLSIHKPEGQNVFAAHVQTQMFLGGVVELEVTLAGKEHLRVVTSPAAIADSGAQCVPGTDLYLSIAPADVVLL